MSQQIPTNFVDQFHGNFETLLRQEGSKLRMCVMEESIRGKQAFFDQIGSQVAQDIIGRHSDVVLTDTPHARRQVTTVTKGVADMIDNQDKIRMLGDPTSEYVKAQVDAMALAIDQAIIAAADGTAYTGVTGTTATAYDTNNDVAITVAEPGVAAGSYGLNTAKIRRMARIFDQNFVPRGDRYIIHNARQLESLLGSTKATSSDYNSVKALVDGEINTFGGFTFVLSQYITTVSTTDYVLAWHRTGMKLALGMEIQTSIDPIPQKWNNVLVQTKMDIGATRMQEGKVGRILCHTTAGPGA